LFSSPDRALRMQLLQQVLAFLPEATVDAQIFPHVAQGFLDTNPAIREQTVKVGPPGPPTCGAPRGRDLPRLLLRVQAGDELGPIRCNATVCLGGWARCSPLTGAGDTGPVPPGAGGRRRAFAATHGCYSVQECASRVLPALCALTTDPHPGVRKQVRPRARGPIAGGGGVSGCSWGGCWGSHCNGGAGHSLKRCWVLGAGVHCNGCWMGSSAGEPVAMGVRVLMGWVLGVGGSGCPMGVMGARAPSAGCSGGGCSHTGGVSLTVSPPLRHFGPSAASWISWRRPRNPGGPGGG
uniref:Uncharacterized protein n=1 Tax=Strigops habroptila TaxID=2489341 RepID=A0A672ULU6_STRHB